MDRYSIADHTRRALRGTRQILRTQSVNAAESFPAKLQRFEIPPQGLVGTLAYFEIRSVHKDNRGLNGNPRENREIPIFLDQSRGIRLTYANPRQDNRGDGGPVAIKAPGNRDRFGYGQIPASSAFLALPPHPSEK